MKLSDEEAQRVERGPERIWATVNGASTRVPDGGRQLIGGWSEDAERPRAIEYVRADLYAALVSEVIEARELLPDLCDDLEAEINARYQPPVHPAMARKYDQDMEIVRRARSFLNKETDNAGE